MTMFGLHTIGHLGNDVLYRCRIFPDWFSREPVPWAILAYKAEGFQRGSPAPGSNKPNLNLFNRGSLLRHVSLGFWVIIGVS
jgi:hypothetical protein